MITNYVLLRYENGKVNVYARTTSTEDAMEWEKSSEECYYLVEKSKKR